MSLSLFRALDDPWARQVANLAEMCGCSAADVCNCGPSPLGACDIWEEDKAVNIAMDAPGLTSDDIKLQLSGRKLTISGEVSCCKAEQPGSQAILPVANSLGRCLVQLAQDHS